MKALSTATAFIVAMAFSNGALNAAETAMLRGDAARTGLSNAAGVPAAPALKWKVKTDAPVASSPIVADGTLFIGSNDGNVYALDVATGAQRWKTKTGGRVASSAAVANGRVFIESYDSQLYALDAATGDVRWKFKTDGERRFTAKHLHGAEPAAELMADPFDFYLSSPAVQNGVVYFGSGDGNIYAVDAAAGTLEWKFKTGDVVHASPTLAGGTLFIGSWDSYFYALDAASGREKWRFKTGEDHTIYNQVGIQSSAVVANGVVYFGCRDSKLYALDASTGKERWSFSNKGSWVIATPIVSGGTLYFSTSDSGMFHAVEAASGKPIYSLKFTWPSFSSPTIAHDVLYIGTHAGKLLAVDLKARKPAWEFVTDGVRENGARYIKPDGTPNYEAAFGRFFHDDMVIGVDRMMSIGAVLSSPVVVGDMVLFGSMDGNVYALTSATPG